MSRQHENLVEQIVVLRAQVERLERKLSDGVSCKRSIYAVNTDSDWKHLYARLTCKQRVFVNNLIIERAVFQLKHRGCGAPQINVIKRQPY